jgi:hypothetical protein
MVCCYNKGSTSTMFSDWSFLRPGPQIRRERNAFECIAQIYEFRLIVSSAKIKFCYLSFMKKRQI